MSSTIGIDIYDINKFNVINKVDVTVWDCAGQLEYASNHQVSISRVGWSPRQYFLSTWNAIYVLVVDASLPLDSQKQNTYFWLRYLKLQLREGNKHPVILVGNKLDLVKSEAEKQATTDFFESLKQAKEVEDYFITSAKNYINTKKVLKFIRDKCSMFLEKAEETFMVPQLYKRVADKIKELRLNRVLITGSFNCSF